MPKSKGNMIRIKQGEGNLRAPPEFPIVKIVPGSHVIKRYQAAKDIIECECGWKDETNKFQAHRKEALPKKSS